MKQAVLRFVGGRVMGLVGSRYQSVVEATIACLVAIGSLLLVIF